jgi:hypothetical protein
VVGGGTASADFELFCLVGDIAGTVTTTCSGSTGPAEGVAVTLLQAGAQYAAGATLADGTYRFDDVPLGTYTVAIAPPAGYGTPVDHHVVSLLAGGETAAADFSLVCLLGSLAVSVVGKCDGVQAPLQGVTVDVYSVDECGEESLVGTAATGADGLVRYDDIALGEYRAVVVSPLGYLTDPAWQQVALAEPGGLTTAAFAPLCQAIAAQPRSMGYWKHQVNVYLSGKGHAQETLDDLLRYIDLMVEHFNGNLVNPVIVYVPVGEHPGDQLLQLSQLLTVNRGGTDLDRAKRQLLALLLNVVSGKLAQTGVISVDGATASQAITHCQDLITDGLAGNDATADRIAEYVNTGVPAPAGLVPVETRVITYHRDPGTEALRLALESVRPNPSPDGFAVWFTVPRPGPASLTLFDVGGRRVWEKDLGELAPGRHLVGATDGPRLPAGVYLLRLKQLGESVAARVAVVR